MSLIQNTPLERTSPEAVIEQPQNQAATRMTSPITFHFEDGCEITLSERTATIREGRETILCDDADKPVFRNDNGEAVVEYTGLATDQREDRSWAKATFDPKGASTPHIHKERTEVYYITAGEAIVKVDDQESHLKAGDHITIPAGTVHPVTNPSSTEALELFVKCFPAWTIEDCHFV